MRAPAGSRGTGGRWAFTALVALFALASFTVLEGFTEGLMPWKIIGCPGCGDLEYDPAIMRWHGAEHGATVGLLFGGSLLLLLWRAHRKPLLLQFYVLGHVVLVAGYAALPGPANEPGAIMGLVVMVAATTGLLVTTYPAPRELLKLSWGRASRPLLALSLVAAAVLLPLALWNLSQQVRLVGIHAENARWTGAAVLAVCLVLAGLLTATKRPGWRELGALTGATYLYLGAAALTVPNGSGSWGLVGGTLSLLFGAGYVVATLREARRKRPPTNTSDRAPKAEEESVLEGGVAS